MSPFETIALALVVSLVAPTTLAFLSGRQRQAEAKQAAAIRATEREADWERQDEVAGRVLEVARKAAADQTENAKQVLEVAKKAASDQEVNAGTLKDIHTLVNSDMTAARTAELSQTRLLVIALKRIPGDLDEATMASIAAAEARAIELEQILADRLVAQRKVEAHAAVEAASA